ncbi:hypothetical protein SAMN05444143_11355 [Flavobacterium succinicans]|jgi:hypothetical protein|uniref:Uncharacterized protein n=1 Tax=Flavobacterium succinicans TaxID=29536 RepID=A0A1I4Z1W3_9FLAO|nr:hypothetical protein [Flavobacterium succinicans]SFN44232.1 hypothetical protein SAMN05444143_11355 [Flavobacterium succinicans]
MATESESIVTEINANIFFKEFTFAKNEFYPPEGQKELADHILWLDNLLFIIQTKERNPKDIKSAAEENNWFKNTVLKKAKNQIKDSVAFFKSYDSIDIQNLQNHKLNVAGAYSEFANNIIIYKPNSDLINEENKLMKFYESSDVGLIHIFHIEYYYKLCRTLHTPTELDDYLKFRERIYLLHKNTISQYPEEYILAHYLNTDNESTIDPHYIATLPNLANDLEVYDMSRILMDFYDKIHSPEHKQSTDYYAILKEIAKMKRYELSEFKKRFTNMFEYVSIGEFKPPERFANLRTGCGFVFISLAYDMDKWENVLYNNAEIYKYKRQLQKCIAVIMFKNGKYRDIYWAFMDSPWRYDQELEEEVVEMEKGFYGPGTIKKYDRYRFTDNQNTNDNRGQY